MLYQNHSWVLQGHISDVYLFDLINLLFSHKLFQKMKIITLMIMTVMTWKSSTKLQMMSTPTFHQLIQNMPIKILQPGRLVHPDPLDHLGQIDLIRGHHFRVRIVHLASPQLLKHLKN